MFLHELPPNAYGNGMVEQSAEKGLLDIHCRLC
jgi:hypothetical protein